MLFTKNFYIANKKTVHTMGEISAQQWIVVLHHLVFIVQHLFGMATFTYVHVSSWSRPS